MSWDPSFIPHTSSLIPLRSLRRRGEVVKFAPIASRHQPRGVFPRLGGALVVFALLGAPEEIAHVQLRRGFAPVMIAVQQRVHAGSGSCPVEAVAPGVAGVAERELSPREEQRMIVSRISHES